MKLAVVLSAARQEERRQGQGMRSTGHRQRLADRQWGFTLLELLVTITVAAILAAVAVPSFRALVQNSARTETVNDFVMALTQARGEAQKQRRPVVVCPLSSAGACSPAVANWQNGWMVYVNMDSATPPAFDSSDRVVQKHVRTRTSPTVTTSAGVTQLVFQPLPRTSTNATFTFCDSRGTAQARQVVIALSGRIRTVEGATTCP